MARKGKAGRGMAGKAWRGKARHGSAGFGRLGGAWSGLVCRGVAGIVGVFEMTDPWINHKDSCAQCGAERVIIADGLCRACWRESNGDAEMEREDLYGD